MFRKSWPVFPSVILKHESLGCLVIKKESFGKAFRVYFPISLKVHNENYHVKASSSKEICSKFVLSPLHISKS